MPRQTLPLLLREKTRHGRIVWYVRKGAGPRVRVHGEYGTPEFVKRYKEALAADPATEGETMVYFIKADAVVKIGFSRNPGKRLHGLRTSSPVKMTIYHVTPGGRELEAELHTRFAKHRAKGEWFVWTKEIEDWIHADMKARRPRLAL